MSQETLIYHSLFYSPDRTGALAATSEIAKRNIPIHEISFEDADGYAVTEQDVLRRHLKKLGLYGKQFAYHAFSPDKLDSVLETGTFYPDSPGREDNVDCCVVNPRDSKLKGIRHDDDYDLVDYMISSTHHSENEAIFAVLDMSRLEERPMQPHPCYRFKNPDRKLDALVAIVRVTDFWG